MEKSVLVSGGLDSATVLAMAIAQGYECHTLSFDYGQRHRAELQAAEQLSAASAAPMHCRHDSSRLGDGTFRESRTWKTRKSEVLEFNFGT